MSEETLSFQNFNDTDDIISSYYTESSNETNKLQKTKKKGGRKFTEIWKYIKRGKKISSGNYEGTCNYCDEFWVLAKPLKLKLHLAKDCLKCPEEITRIFINELAKDEIQDNENPKKKQCGNETSIQTILNFERIKISDSKIKEIDNILLKAFVCCNIAFNIIENPFFIELLKTLCAGYNPPSRRKLATELLEREVIRINLKVEKVLKNTLNLTLAIDG